MIPTRLHHVSLSVRDIEKAREFYGGLLGLPEIERPDLPFPGAWYRLGGTEIHLIVPSADADVGSPPGGLNPMAYHSAFAIEDYEAVRGQLKARGLQLLESPRMKQLWVRDPDGNVLEFIQAPL